MKTVYLDSCSRKIKSCWLCNINEHRLLKTNYCISSINEKMFRDKPTKQIHNWTHSQHQKKKKNEVWKFVLKLCQMKLKMCSSTYDVNRAKFVLKLCQMKQKICFSTMYENIMWTFPRLFLTVWFFSHATFRGCCVVHAA